MLNYWGLTSPINPRHIEVEDLFYPASWKHQLDKLMYTCEQGRALTHVKSFSKHGKTATLRWLYQSLPSSTYQPLVFSLSTLQTQEKWLATEVGRQLGIKTTESSDLHKPIQEILRQLSLQSVRTIILVDNASFIANQASFSDILGLKNICDLSALELNIVLFVDEKWKVNTHKPLTSEYFDIELPKLKEFETNQLVHHILTKSGVSKPIVEESALRLIHQSTKGIIGRIRELLEFAFFEAFISKRQVITGDFLNKILTNNDSAQIVSTKESKKLSINIQTERLRPNDISKPERRKPKITLGDLYLNEETDGS